MGVNHDVGKNMKHLIAAMQWICRAQDANPGGGVSGWYDITKNTWVADYPETTGYIIPTFFDFYRLTKKEEYKIRAVKMADWECEVQMSQGAIQSGLVSQCQKTPTVFNTGQVILGWVRAFQETKDKKYLESFKRAADWLCEIQDTDGAWRKGSSLIVKNSLNTYNTRVAWALLEVYFALPHSDHKYLNSAINNINWAIEQQNENGWFENNSFDDNSQPLLHTIAYAISGILEAGILLKMEMFIKSATIAADALISKQLPDGSLYGKYNNNWFPTVKWSCLTGNAQMAIIWFELFEVTKNQKYLIAAKKMNNYLKTTQDLITSDLNIKGGIKGSQPIYGGYVSYCYINWAAKFFADGLILEERYSDL